MNDRDSKNLDFLLNIGKDVFDEWMQMVEYDDIMYAIELLTTKRTSLLIEELEKSDEVEDTAIAKALIKNIMEQKRG
ncbi:MAG: hypothetical protein EBU90_23405 [Proteobacteria bacterium]|nr:hypothetical protein [Pseudomonadota bacterium]NBP16424.1 hypothetical protein [bacterium]